MKPISSKNFRLYTNVTFVAGAVILMVGLISFTWILFTQSTMKPCMSSEGFEEFFKLFKGPLSFLGASVILLAAWLTLVRIEQTQTQIDLLGQNNRFNNYYKHIQEFTDQLQSEPFLTRFFSITGSRSQRIYLAIYREFYYRHPLDFKPRINDNSLEIINRFLVSLTGSSLNRERFDFASASPTELELILAPTAAFGERFKELVHIIIQKDTASLTQRLKERNIAKPETDSIIRKFELLNKVHWMYRLFSSLLVFDGADDPNLAKVITNFELARGPLGI